MPSNIFKYSGNMPINSYSIRPLHFRDKAKTEDVQNSPFRTFTCEDPSGQSVSEIDVPQAALFNETETQVPVIANQPIGQKDCYDFRSLIGVNARKDVTCAWVAFELMAKWLNTGVYQNDESEATHIDAYLLSEKLSSPRFGNAVMSQILSQIHSTKNDETLANIIRRACDESSEYSLLKKLYFDTAIWWFPPNGYLHGTRNPKYFGGAGLLNSNDAYWLNALEDYKRETCTCSPSERKKAHNKWEEENDEQIREKRGGCHLPPWMDWPERYYAV